MSSGLLVRGDRAGGGVPPHAVVLHHRNLVARQAADGRRASPGTPGTSCAGSCSPASSCWRGCWPPHPSACAGHPVVTGLCRWGFPCPALSFLGFRASVLWSGAHRRPAFSFAGARASSGECMESGGFPRISLARSDKARAREAAWIARHILPVRLEKFAGWHRQSPGNCWQSPRLPPERSTASARHKLECRSKFQAKPCLSNSGPEFALFQSRTKKAG